MLQFITFVWVSVKIPDFEIPRNSGAENQPGVHRGFSKNYLGFSLEVLPETLPWVPSMVSPGVDAWVLLVLPSGFPPGISSEIPPEVFLDLPLWISTGIAGLLQKFFPKFLPRFLQIFLSGILKYSFPQEFFRDYSWIPPEIPSRTPSGVTSQVSLIASSRITWGCSSEITPIWASGIPSKN